MAAWKEPGDVSPTRSESPSALVWIVGLATDPLRRVFVMVYTEKHRTYRASAKFCALCGEPFLYGDDPTGLPRWRGYRRTIEHIIPRKKGGGDNFENLTVSHDKCNSERGGEVGNAPLYCIMTGVKLPVPETLAITNLAEAEWRRRRAELKYRLTKAVNDGAYPPGMTIPKEIFNDLVANLE